MLERKWPRRKLPQDATLCRPPPLQYPTDPCKIWEDHQSQPHRDTPRRFAPRGALPTMRLPHRQPNGDTTQPIHIFISSPLVWAAGPPQKPLGHKGSLQSVASLQSMGIAAGSPIAGASRIAGAHGIASAHPQPLGSPKSIESIWARPGLECASGWIWGRRGVAVGRCEVYSWAEIPNIRTLRWASRRLGLSRARLCTAAIMSSTYARSCRKPRGCHNPCPPHSARSLQSMGSLQPMGSSYRNPRQHLSARIIEISAIKFKWSLDSLSSTTMCCQSANMVGVRPPTSNCGRI